MDRRDFIKSGLLAAAVGAVSDFNGNPMDSCTVMWQNSSFDNVIQTLTDSQGRYVARIPKGKYQSMAAVRLNDYPHTAKAGVSDADQLKATVWIDGEEVPVLMKQEIKEYYEADEYGNAYLLTVDRPKLIY